MKLSIAPDFIHFLGKDRKISALCITEYNEAETMKLIREESEARGETKGEIKGAIKQLVGFIKDGFISEKQAAERADMSLDEFRKYEVLYSSLFRPYLPLKGRKTHNIHQR